MKKNWQGADVLLELHDLCWRGGGGIQKPQSSQDYLSLRGDHLEPFWIDQVKDGSTLEHRIIVYQRTRSLQVVQNND